jgi:hypothetical protein
VRVSLTLTILFGLLVAAPGSAQPSWKQALERGDDAAAVRLLGALVFEQGDVFPPADETEQLATLYLEGRGVPQDKALACSLLDLASRSARFRSRMEQPDTRLERRRDDVCERLPPDERLEAAQLLGCFKVGPERQSYALDSGHWIEISRQGIRIHYDNSDSMHDLPAFPCGTQFLPARYTRVTPANSTASRHFLELFASLRHSWPDESARPHVWQLMEVVGGSVQFRTGEALHDPRDPHEPVTLVPVVHFRARSDGTVTWRFDNGAFSGTIPPPQPPPEPPDELPPVEPGSGRIDVAVTDRFGAPMPGVVVTLRGLVSTELNTDAIGAVSFVDLPDGRYDVVASLKGFPSSLPRVIDLPGLATPVEIVLKPSAPVGSIAHACGGLSPTLEQLSADADAIAHVKVARQRSYRQKRDESYRGSITTALTVRWIRSFKSNSRVSAGDEIVQGGGRLEKADDIEIATVNDFAPLNVGDEYVLFLKRYDELGYVVIHHAENGAFLIRNGRVKAMGKGALANAWKDRSAAKFFEALRTSLKAGATR